jgi:DNA-binding transcriptional ArsR family regulator
MAKPRLTAPMIALVAERFRALAEPTRLHLMHALRDGERTVGELVEATGLSTANVSKHLQLLHGAGFVARRKDGLYVHYRLADDDVLRLCDIMCGRLDAEADARRRALTRRAQLPNAALRRWPAYACASLALSSTAAMPKNSCVTPS